MRSSRACTRRNEPAATVLKLLRDAGRYIDPGIDYGEPLVDRYALARRSALCLRALAIAAAACEANTIKSSSSSAVNSGFNPAPASTSDTQPVSAAQPLGPNAATRYAHSCHNGRRHVVLLSLFSGCGGLDLGFERVGFEVGLAYDIRKASIASWNQNRPERPNGHVAGPIDDQAPANGPRPSP